VAYAEFAAASAWSEILVSARPAKSWATRPWVVVLVTVAVLAALSWISDTLTLQGERTVYTVQCESGSWDGPHCSGRLTAAERFKFRALQAHREVLFWIVGSSQPSGKFTDCTIDSGRDWTCRCDAEAAGAITCQMLYGRPVRQNNPLLRAFHTVPKWRWFLLRAGIPSGSDAND